ncbi:MAG: DUF4421 domain-containing protein [Muribaculum sp.]|nr:DUF4421 domain-containing protein [Muribaculum sp.]
MSFSRFWSGVVWCVVCMMSIASAQGANISYVDPARQDSVSSDTIKWPAYATPEWRSKNWVKQLMANGFRINDPGINYPKFMRFCLKVYNWGDRTFNSYNPEYVVGSGKNWKFFGKSYTWAESYAMYLPDDVDVRMTSAYYSDLGLSLNFMALSIGYTFNANDLFRHPVANRANFEFNFTCALFSGSYTHASTNGGVTITHFGDYNDGKRIHYDFNAVNHDMKTGSLYYFFNHRKYSHAAAYCYSKYQMKSAGTWICGFNFNTQEIDIDFTKLPLDMLKFLPDDRFHYRFHYTDYNLLGGYAYNWVPRPKRWLFNITAMPALGYKHLYGDSADGRKDMFSANLKMMGSIVFNYKALFASLTGRFDGHIYMGRSYTFLNSTESLTFLVGFRF